MNLIPLPALAERNKSFSPSVPGLQLIWDSTSYREFQTCPWKYYLTIIQGIVPRFRNINLTFGIAWHTAQERYYTLLAAGASKESALEDTIAETYFRQLRTESEWTLSFWGHHEESIPFDQEKPKPEKTPRTLLRAFIAYHSHYSSDPLHTVIMPSGKPAVEYSFCAPIPSTPFSWAGHLDRVVAETPLDLSKPLTSPPPAVYNIDYKTTSSALNGFYFDQYSPDIQMSGYALGTQVALPIPAKGVYVDAIQLLPLGQRFQRFPIPRSSSHLEEFLTGFLSDMKEAERYAEEQNWPMRFTSCRGPYGDCIFRQVCASAPHMRLQKLKAFFDQRIWDPSIPR
jgi:hypothetical protein